MSPLNSLARRLRHGSRSQARAWKPVLESLEARHLLSYTFTDLGTLGGLESSAYAVNDLGQVAGESVTPSGDGHCFLYSDGQMADLGTLGQGGTATGLNNLGAVVGYSRTPAGDVHAFLCDPAIHDLGTLGGFISDAGGINDSGWVAGDSVTTSGDYHLFRVATGGIDGQMNDLGTLPSCHWVETTGINASGQVVGSAGTTSLIYHAFLWTDGVMQDLGTLGGAQSYGYGINDLGQVAGTAQVEGGAYHAFIWSNGTMQDLGIYGPLASVATAINSAGQVVGRGGPNGNVFLYSDGVMLDLTTLIDYDPGWRLIDVRGINNSGQIVGTAINPQGRNHGFLLTPDQPLTASWRLLLGPVASSVSAVQPAGNPPISLTSDIGVAIQQAALENETGDAAVAQATLVPGPHIQAEKASSPLGDFTQDPFSDPLAVSWER